MKRATVKSKEKSPKFGLPTFKLHVDFPVEVLQVSAEFMAVTGFKLLLGTQRTRLTTR